MAQTTVNFYSIFKVNPDGSIAPIRPVRIGGIQLGPGERFGGGVSFGGVDLSQQVGKNFLVEEIDGILVIVGIF